MEELKITPEEVKLPSHIWNTSLSPNVSELCGALDVELNKEMQDIIKWNYKEQ